LEEEIERSKTVIANLKDGLAFNEIILKALEEEMSGSLM